ncbi:nucleoside hydrolase [Metabacillus sp. GX 13764]|uniref:nucleoside hydrolase n=1 Tax=Metabacillus kandeliae TaxID=2900151 RepID=UPI001E426790|nr:nucleoside hydrolase [Metabacillus kandeliae]MCD7033466.1 nucleoside hydrolase [Metabacillus kandeliae]
MKNILFFSDFGIDDLAAAIYALYDQDINIIGIVADYGNVSKRDAARNAVYLQEVSGKFEIPVYGGAESALTGEKPEYYPEIHGPAGFGPIIPKPVNGIGLFENFYEVTSLIAKYGNNVTIVNVGRLTSLATAFLLYPKSLSQISDIFLMGGAFFYPGNITPAAEANFYSDPVAANIVLTLGKPITIIPLNVTNRAILTQHQVDGLDAVFRRKGEKAGQLLKPLLDYYSAYYKRTVPGIQGGPLHDVLTLWSSVNEDAFTFAKKPVKVVAENGPARGLSIADFRPYKKLAEYPVHRIALDFDEHYYTSSILSAFEKGLPQQHRY